jgi:hypothetical protein
MLGRYKEGHALDLIGTLAKMVNERLEYAMHGRVLDAVTLKRGRSISQMRRRITLCRVGCISGSCGELNRSISCKGTGSCSIISVPGSTVTGRSIRVSSGIVVHQNRAKFVAMCEVAHAAINPFIVRHSSLLKILRQSQCSSAAENRARGWSLIRLRPRSAFQHASRQPRSY